MEEGGGDHHGLSRVGGVGLCGMWGDASEVGDREEVVGGRGFGWLGFFPSACSSSVLAV